MCKWKPFHNFDKWEKEESGDITREEFVKGKYIVQKRQCKDCGFIQLNKQILCVV